MAHLFAGGRGVVAHIAGPQDMIAGRDRLDGYRAAVGVAGQEFDDSLVEVGRFQRGERCCSMRALLARRPDVDAVFAASDPMALGALPRAA